jgi:hypothetical protein
MAKASEPATVEMGRRSSASDPSLVRATARVLGRAGHVSSLEALPPRQRPGDC